MLHQCESPSQHSYSCWVRAESMSRSLPSPIPKPIPTSLPMAFPNSEHYEYYMQKLQAYAFSVAQRRHSEGKSKGIMVVNTEG